MIDLSRLPHRPKRVTGSINPATGEVSGSWLTLYYDWEGTLPNLGGWIEQTRRAVESCGFEVGEVATSPMGIAQTETDGVWGGSIRFGVRCRPNPAETTP